MKYSGKPFSHYPANEGDSNTFLQPSDKEEIAKIISLNLIEHYFF